MKYVVRIYIWLQILLLTNSTVEVQIHAKLNNQQVSNWPNDSFAYYQR